MSNETLDNSPRKIVTSFVLLDGLFHLTQSLETFMQFAPDWIIGQALGGSGFGVLFHRVMGIVLILTSLAVYMNNERISDNMFLVFYYTILAPITLAVIAIALGIRILG